MCGRYASSASRAQLIETFLIDDVIIDRASGAQSREPELWLGPRWNIAPTDTVAVVLERLARPTADGSEDPGQDSPDQAELPVFRSLAGLRWGLVPSWSKDPKAGARMINARLETVADKPAFRKAFASRRCLVPADGYYEWYPMQVAGKTVKQPFFVYPAHPVPVRDGPGLMAMAGIYEYWRDPAPAPGTDPWLVSCAIITTQATDDLGMIHDRMPVQIHPEDWAEWLDPRVTDPAHARTLFHAPQAGEMRAHAVSRRVSRVGNEGPDLTAPLSIS